MGDTMYCYWVIACIAGEPAPGLVNVFDDKQAVYYNGRSVDYGYFTFKYPSCGGRYESHKDRPAL